jgi:hypothetical protein
VSVFFLIFEMIRQIQVFEDFVTALTLKPDLYLHATSNCFKVGLICNGLHVRRTCALTAGSAI